MTATIAGIALLACSAPGASSHATGSPAAACVPGASPSTGPATPTPTDSTTGYYFLISQGETIVQRVTARPQLYQWAVQVRWSSGDIQLSLTSPSGKVYDRSTTDPDAHHNFNDNSESFAFDPERIEAGEWTARLYGADVPSGVEKVSMGVLDIPLADLAPQADAQATPDRGVAPVTVQFDSVGSVALFGATITSYAWDFGDCSPEAKGPTATHVYKKPGHFTATLKVADSRGLSSSSTITIFITATDQPPCAKFEWGILDPSRPDLIVFDARDSGDVDGRVVGYHWDFGDGSAGNGEAVARAYAKAGTYHVRLTVTDDGGLTASTEQDVTTGQVVSGTPSPCSG